MFRKGVVQWGAGEKTRGKTQKRGKNGLVGLFGQFSQDFVGYNAHAQVPTLNSPRATKAVLRASLANEEPCQLPPIIWLCAVEADTRTQCGSPFGDICTTGCKR